MCEEHASAGIPCPSLSSMNAGAESIGAALMKAPAAIIGATAGVCLAASLLFVIENFIWFALGIALATAAVGTVLVRKTLRNLRDGRATWQPSMATTQHRLNGAPRPAVEPPRRPAIEAPRKPLLPPQTAQALAELAGAIIPVQAAGRQALTERTHR